MKIRTTELRDRKIKTIFAKRNKIEIDPPYQRNGGIWNLNKKQKFLDSIFNGFDVPKIYFHEYNTYSKQRSKGFYFSIIDGKQRLETIWEFINNKLPLGDFKISRLKIPENLDGVFYEELSKRYLGLKSFFDNYPLSIMKVSIEKNEEELVSELFLRLNSGNTLTAPERRNAIGGKMAKLIRDIAEHEFFTHYIRVPNNRYQHYEIVAQLLLLEHLIEKNSIADTKNKYLNQLVKNYKKRLPDDRSLEKILEFLDIMMTVFPPKDSLLGKRTRMTLYYLLIREAKRQGELKRITPDSLDQFYAYVEDNKDRNGELEEFNLKSQQGTNDASSIKRRFEIMSKRFKINSDKIVGLKRIEYV